LCSAPFEYAVGELPRLSVFGNVLNLVFNRIFGSSTAIFRRCNKNLSFIRQNTFTVHQILWRHLCKVKNDINEF
jgi:hypothetical protein